MSELLNNALTGVNIIPTILLGFVLFYWLTVIIGVIDFDLFDIDIDIDGDFDVDTGGDIGPFHAFLAFLNLADLPFMLVFSVIILVFWIIAMFMFLLPITPGGLTNGLLLIHAFIVSILIAKIITNPLKKVFKKVYEEEEYQGEPIVGQIVILTCELKEGRLGQGEIKREGASILINVRQYDNEETFEKGEEAYVIKKDDEKNIYYIIKIKE